MGHPQRALVTRYYADFGTLSGRIISPEVQALATKGGSQTVAQVSQAHGFRFPALVRDLVTASSRGKPQGHTGRNHSREDRYERRAGRPRRRGTGRRGTHAQDRGTPHPAEHRPRCPWYRASPLAHPRESNVASAQPAEHLGADPRGPQ